MAQPNREAGRKHRLLSNLTSRHRNMSRLHSNISKSLLCYCDMCLASADTRADAAGLAGRLHCGQKSICLLAARFVPTRHSSAGTILADQSASVAAAVSAVCHGVLPTPRGAQGSSTSLLCRKFLSASAAVYGVFGTISSLQVLCNGV